MLHVAVKNPPTFSTSTPSAPRDFQDLELLRWRRGCAVAASSGTGNDASDSDDDGLPAMTTQSRKPWRPRSTSPLALAKVYLLGNTEVDDDTYKGGPYRPEMR